MNTSISNEWQRVRAAPGTYACDRFSWLRPAEPGSIILRQDGRGQTVPVVMGKGKPPRFRMPRVDEATAVLDVQFVVDDLHNLDRSKIYMRRYYFHPDQLVLNLAASSGAIELRLLVTTQNLGKRYWWACPTCGARRRYLYYYRLPDSQRPNTVSGLLGCRQCLGLTYRSRARHRCDDHDRARALDGDLKAAARVLSRIVQRQYRDDVLIEALRRKLRRRVGDLAQAGRE